MLVAGLLTLPAFFAAQALLDRDNYNAALEAIRTGDPALTEGIDRGRLLRTLNRMNGEHKAFILGRPSRGGGGFWQTGVKDMPLLGALYGKIVYDGMPLANREAALLDNAFFSGAGTLPDMSSWGIRANGYALTGHGARTRFDAEQGVYYSWVDLEIQNTLFDTNRLEYATEFTLPQDAFITDYYLYVGDENKQGLLAERRAANQVYQSIVRRKRDPGLLRYEAEDTLSLRVFPFAARQVRKTGFEVMHIRPMELLVESKPLLLDAPIQSGVAHVPADLGGHGPHCAPDTCTELLALTGHPYDDARVLAHNTGMKPGPMERVGESFAQRVLTSRTSFIVLESAAQEHTLRLLQQRILNGEEIPERFLAMSEPGEMAMLLLAVAIPLLFAYRKKRRGVRRAYTNLQQKRRDLSGHFVI